ncbi:MAG: type II toxin-antitoxin system MqsR family toxin [Coriobacteriia bacterium]|nr:type II toxin-antitoxin system MqsR family toxin [Coriobacteriia bacterium]
MPGGSRERRCPAYPLNEVRAAFGAGRFEVTGRVRRHLERRGWGFETVQRRICDLCPGDFHKSQAHRTEPGVWLDIYKPFVNGERLYVKYMPFGDGESFIVLSFCGDGEQH